MNAFAVGTAMLTAAMLVGCGGDISSTKISADCRTGCDNDAACVADSSQCVSICDDIGYVVYDLGCNETAFDYFGCASTTTSCDDSRETQCGAFFRAYQDCICSATRCDAP